MLIKAYIKSHFFHLPMDEAELLNQVEKALNTGVNKASIQKIHPLTKIEDNENILVEKQKTNIFLLNLLLLVLNHNKKDITVQNRYNESFIILSLEKETELNLNALPFEGVEKEVGKYLNPTSEKPQMETEMKNEEQTEKETYLGNVQFSINWLKGAQEEINRPKGVIACRKSRN